MIHNEVKELRQQEVKEMELSQMQKSIFIKICRPSLDGGLAWRGTQNWGCCPRFRRDDPSQCRSISPL